MKKKLPVGAYVALILVYCSCYTKGWAPPKMKTYTKVWIGLISIQPSPQIISGESPQKQHSPKPEIPNICDNTGQWLCGDT